MIFSHLKAYKLAYLWAIIVTCLCGTNGNNIPNFEFSSLIKIDKIAHFILFGTETYLIAIGSKKNNPTASNFKNIFPGVIIGTAFGITIEILQATVFPNRSFDYLDMVANTTGCLIAWVLLNWRFKKTKI
jgi:VanZ family protein